MPSLGLTAAAIWDLLAWPLLRSAAPSRFASSRVPGEGRELRWVEQTIERSALLSKAFMEPAWRLRTDSADGNCRRGEGRPSLPPQNDGRETADGTMSSHKLKAMVVSPLVDAISSLRERSRRGQVRPDALKQLATAIPVDIARVYEVDPTYHGRPLWKTVPSPEERAGHCDATASSTMTPDDVEIYRPVAKYLKFRRVIRHEGGRASLSPKLLSWYSTTPYNVRQLYVAGKDAAQRLRREQPELLRQLDDFEPSSDSSPDTIAESPAIKPANPPDYHLFTTGLHDGYTPIGPRQIREAMTLVSAEMLLVDEAERLAGRIGGSLPR